MDECELWLFLVAKPGAIEWMEDLEGFVDSYAFAEAEA